MNIRLGLWLFVAVMVTGGMMAGDASAQQDVAKTAGTAKNQMENPALIQADKRLDRVHTDIARDYPDVRHLPADVFQGMVAEETIVFDVRKPSEYAVSHLPGAINIAPDMTAEAFIAAYGNTFADKKIVFYCSVGRRSSIMADRMAAQLGKDQQSYNLVGGIFRWRNEERPLEMSRSDGATLPTDYVHPYNAVWGRYLADRKAIRYSPRVKAQPTLSTTAKKPSAPRTP
ncbi:MAG: rhodanese-like domain-containing protein [Pseudomonadota bacterium]